MKKALMFSSVASMIDLFNMNNINTLQDIGYQVDVACNFEEGNITSKERIKEFKNELTERGVDYFHLPIPRSIHKIQDIYISYKLTKELIKKNKYNVIHCHSPIGSVISRLAARKSGAKIIYTAHGFHFYKGAPLTNWIVYYPIEKIMSYLTDILITINEEDYKRAINFPVRTKVKLINGIGVDLEKFNKDSSINKVELLKEYNIKENDIILTSIGQLSKRKNHRLVLDSLAKLKNNRIKYFVIGEGELRAELSQMIIEKKLEKNVFLLGYKNNVSQYLSISDMFIFPSLQEGLPVSLMEAMSNGLPSIVTDIRGNRDLIDHEKGGFLVSINDPDELSNKIEQLIENPLLANKMRQYNIEKIKLFGKENINKEMYNIYCNHSQE